MQSTAPSHSTGRSSLTRPDAVGTGPLETLLLRPSQQKCGGAALPAPQGRGPQCGPLASPLTGLNNRRQTYTHGQLLSVVSPKGAGAQEGLQELQPSLGRTPGKTL